MATIKDIAKLAGVSHGTVSNVMNHKGIVNSEKIRLVEEAARRLGYHTNAQAQKLRKGNTRHLAFLLPDIEQDIYRSFYISLKDVAEASHYDTSLFLTGYSPETEKEKIKEALSNRPEYIVFFPCNEERDAYEGINAKAIFINCPELMVKKRQASFSFDFAAVSQSLAEKIRLGHYRSVAFFFDSSQALAHRFLFESLNKNLKYLGVSLVPFFFSSKNVHHGAIAVIESRPPFDLVITHNPSYVEKLCEAGELLCRKPPEMISFGIYETILFSSYLRYEFNYRELAYRVWDHISKSGDDEKKFSCSFILKPRGFREMKKFPVRPQRNGELNMLTVASPSARILSTLTPYLERSTGIKLRVIALPYEELFQLLSLERVSNLDLIRIDMAWRTRMEKRIFISLSSQEEKIKNFTASFLPSINEVYLPDIRSLYTLPFDPSIQMFFYRRDIFENPILRRLYYEKTKDQLAIPQDFESYNRIAEFFTASLNTQSPVRFGATMVYGTAIVAASDILPRIQTGEGKYFDRSGRINITSRVFKKALEDYIKLKEYSPPDIMYWWNDAIRSFTYGLSAMTIVFTNHASDVIRISEAGLSAKVGAAPVPGNHPLLGGGCIGIARQSKKIDLCLEFLDWVYSNEIANMITLLGGLSPVKSVFENEEILEIYPWLRNIGDRFRQGWRKIESPKYAHFDNYQFELILGNAVRNAVLGIMSIEEALANAQQECDKEFKPQ
jgi:multiple sugar transport system substrate-binding protein